MELLCYYLSLCVTSVFLTLLRLGSRTCHMEVTEVSFFLEVTVETEMTCSKSSAQCPVRSSLSALGGGILAGRVIIGQHIFFFLLREVFFPTDIRAATRATWAEGSRVNLAPALFQRPECLALPREPAWGGGGAEGCILTSAVRTVPQTCYDGFPSLASDLAPCSNSVSPKLVYVTLF